VGVTITRWFVGEIAGAGNARLPVPIDSRSVGWHFRPLGMGTPFADTRGILVFCVQEGLPAFTPADRYRYVLLDIWFLTVTRRSVALGAKAAALTFTALQVSFRVQAAFTLSKPLRGAFPLSKTL
jgi:hypothetical protein